MATSALFSFGYVFMGGLRGEQVVLKAIHKTRKSHVNCHVGLIIWFIYVDSMRISIATSNEIAL